jgi:cytochrome P450
MDTLRVMPLVPLDPISAVTAPDPYEFYSELVAERPLYFDDRLHLWVASSAEAVEAVLANPRCRVRPAREPVPRPLAGSVAGDVFGSLVRMTDGERHRALKSAVERAFESLPLPSVERAARGQARTFAVPDRAPADGSAVTRFAFRFPIFVIAALLGVPESSFSDIADATQAFAAGLAPDADTPQRGTASAAAEHLRAVVARHVSTTSTDADVNLLEAFRRAAHAESIDEHHIVANAVGFLFQTCDATAGLIGNSLVALGRKPDVLERVTREPQDLRAAIEEVARFDPPVQNTRRFVETAGLVAGEAMQAGDAVLVLLAAANRDPAANPDPDRFDDRRPIRRLFTFGLGGHACPGRVIAVAIAAAGVRRLLEEGVDPRPLAAAFSYRPSVNLRLPIFSPSPIDIR